MINHSGISSVRVFKILKVKQPNQSIHRLKLAAYFLQQIFYVLFCKTCSIFAIFMIFYPNQNMLMKKLNTIYLQKYLSFECEITSAT